MKIRRFNQGDCDAWAGAREFESGELPFIGEAEVEGLGEPGEVFGAQVIGAREGIEIWVLAEDGTIDPYKLQIEGEKGIEAVLQSLPETLTPEILRDYGFRS